LPTPQNPLTPEEYDGTKYDTKVPPCFINGEPCDTLIESGDKTKPE